MNHLRLISIALLAFTSSSVFAEGFYARGAAGQAQIDDDDLQIKDDDTFYGLFLGYRFHPAFGVEAGYIDLGKHEESVRLNNSPVQLDAEARGFTVGVSGKYLFGDEDGFFVDGRAGMVRAELEGKLIGRIGSTQAAVGFEDKTKFKPYYGVGVGYDFSKAFGVGLGFTRYEVGDRFETEIDTVMLSAEFRF